MFSVNGPSILKISFHGKSFSNSRIQRIYFRKNYSFRNLGHNIRPPDKRCVMELFFLFLNQNMFCGFTKRTVSIQMLWVYTMSTQNISLNQWVRKYLQFYSQKVYLSEPVQYIFYPRDSHVYTLLSYTYKGGNSLLV